MELAKHLPSFYYAGAEVRSIQASIDAEEELVKAAITDLLDQLFVNTATWGLSSWEAYLGLDSVSGEDIQSRRGRVMTRLRGQGTTTKEMLMNVCSSFSGGEVEIIEHYPDYSFTVKFVGTLGIPSNIGYLAKSIDEIKPAHLAYSFLYTFNTHKDLSVHTHAELKRYTHKELKEKRW